MLNDRFCRLLLVLLMASFMNACSTGLVYNDAPSGAIFVKPKEPERAPVSTWKPPTAAVTTKLTVPQQNKKAILAFRAKGFEAVLSDKGVVVYLSPSINFKGSDSTLSENAKKRIAEIAQELNQAYLSDRYIEVSGHTDSSGSKSLNMALSKKRSLTATSELLSSGVRNTRLNSTWFGETRLRAPDFNADGSVNAINRNLNRRVEFTVLNPE